MTDYVWTGAISTASATAGNWSPAAVPTASDNVTFNDTGAGNCVWTLTQINNITLDTTAYNLILDTANLTIAGVFHFDGNLEIDTSESAVLIKFTGSGESLITFDNETNWVNGDTDKAKTTFEILGTANNIMFQNGKYPIVKIGANTTVSPHVPTAPNNTYTETDFYQLTFANTGKFAETSAVIYSSDPKLERSKVFRIRSIGTWSPERFEGGKATWVFYATTAGFELPLSGSNISTATSFEGKVAQIKVVATAIGQKIKVPPGPHYLEKLIIDVGVMCLCDREIAELHMTNRPTIDGAWQFFQITDGIYRSAKEDMILPITHGGTGQKNAQDAINALSQVSAATNEHVLTKDTTTGDAIWKAASGGGAVSSVFGRTGAVVATEGDYDLDKLGDVDITSAVEAQILRHDGTSFINEYNDIMFLRVKAREAINKGEAVYIFDAHNSNVVGVKKARADSASTMPCIGIVYETLALGDEGLAVSFGKANGIAANFTEGETMYVSPTTAGALTNTKPTGTTHLIQNVGILMQTHASNAVVKVTGIGRVNDVPNQFSVGGSITAGSFVKSGGASSEFLKADGSVDTNTYLTSYTETDPIFAASEAALLVAGDKTKLDSLQNPFQHLRVHLTNNSLGSQSAGTAYYLDLANTSNYTSTGNTTDIVITNDTQDYISLGAGGMYMVVASIEMFTASGTAAQDFWLQLGNGTSSNAERRNWGTARFKVKAVSSASDCAINMQKTVIIDVASGGSDEKLYVIPQVNGVSFEVKAYDNNRTNITITRIGASTS